MAALGAGLVVLALDHSGIGWLVIPLAIAAAALFGAAWAAVPAALQACRGSHIVITTIMFNFLASALMVYLMVNVLMAPDAVAPESRDFADSAALPLISSWLNAMGLHVAESPLNLSIVFAAIACAGVWALVWHTPWGQELRMMGFNPSAAIYAGARPRRITMIAMALSGALAGLVGVNEILGVHHRLLLDFAAGYGFGGIAVALMGRNHPVGIVLASLLFGILQQGGTELSFAMPQITREMVIAIQGLVILFSGALTNMSRPWFEWTSLALGRRLQARRAAEDTMNDILTILGGYAAPRHAAYPLRHGRAVLGAQWRHRCRAGRQDAGGGLRQRHHRLGHPVGLDRAWRGDRGRLPDGGAAWPGHHHLSRQPGGLRRRHQHPRVRPYHGASPWPGSTWAARRPTSTRRPLHAAAPSPAARACWSMPRWPGWR